MKKTILILTALASLTMMNWAQAKEPRIEQGFFTSKNGTKIVAVYELWKNQDSQVYLIFPDGSKIQITVQVGTPTKVMDASLQRLIDNDI